VLKKKYENEKISPMLRVEKIPVGPLMTNCYLVWDDQVEQGVIIDPGDWGERIIERVKEHGLVIDSILATHCHFDHIGAVASIKREIDAEFVIHKEDLYFVKDCENAARKWGFSIEQPPDPDRYIVEGDVVKVGNQTLRVVYTPGHSPGGISYLNDGMVFAGDCLFQRSIGRTDFRGGSFEILDRTIKTKLYSLTDDTIVYTGHGPDTTVGEEKRHNPFVRP